MIIPSLGTLLSIDSLLVHGATISTPQEEMRREQYGKKSVGFADADIQLLHELSPATDMYVDEVVGRGLSGQVKLSIRSSTVKLPIVVQASECP